MIKVYGKKSCNSTKKALEWFNKYQVDVDVYKLSLINREDLIEALSKGSIGLDGLVKSSSRVSSQNQKKLKKLQDMGFNEGIDYLIENPNLLQTPVIIGKKISLIGYNSEELRHFLSRKYRRYFSEKLKNFNN